MSAHRVAVRYARALTEALDEKNALDQASHFLKFAELVRANKELTDLFANVTVAAEDKARVVSALGQRLGLPEMIRNFLNVMAGNGRLGILAETEAATRAQLDVISGIQTVVLTTADELAAADMAGFETAMKSLLDCEVRIQASTDPSILGGAVAQVGSVVYDGSVRAQLDRLRSDLIKEI